MAKPVSVGNLAIPQKMDTAADKETVSIKTLHRENMSRAPKPPIAPPLPFSGTELQKHVSAEKGEEKTEKEVPMTDDTKTPPSETAKVATETPPAKRGRKNGRFGKLEEGEERKVKPAPERKSPWGKYLFEYKQQHPELNPLEATIEARKRYVPENGKKKSYQKLFAEVWKIKNPDWRRFTESERQLAMRQSFIDYI
jgi:hypothetical protein